MKKLYALIIGAAFVSGQASAENTVRAAAPGQMLSMAAALPGVDRVPVAPQTSSIDDYSDYTWTLLGTGQYQASAVAGVFTGEDGALLDVQVYEADGHSGVYKAVGVWSDILTSGDGVLIVDASNPDFITVPNQLTGIKRQNDGDTYIASFSWVYREQFGYTEAEIIEGLPAMLPKLNDGCITFPARSLMLQWPDAPEGSSIKPSGWYFGGDYSGCLVLPGGTYHDPWTLVGEGTFSGDVLYQTFGVAGSDYQVDVYRSSSDEAIYRVVDPLKGLYASLKVEGTSPSWKLDVTNPDNVVLPMTSTGLGNATSGLFYVGTKNQDYDTDEECPEEYRTTFTNDKGNISFSIPVQGLTLYANTSGQTIIGNRAAVTLTVFDESSAIEDIITDTADIDAPAEYFNLQGIKVANPEPGQLYIVRQGKKVCKIIK